MARKRRSPPSRQRYDLAHPTISVRVSQCNALKWSHPGWYHDHLSSRGSTVSHVSGRAQERLADLRPFARPPGSAWPAPFWSGRDCPGEAGCVPSE